MKWLEHSVTTDLPKELKDFCRNNPKVVGDLLAFVSQKVYNEYQKAQESVLKPPSEVQNWSDNQTYLRGYQAGLAYAHKILATKPPELKPNE